MKSLNFLERKFSEKRKVKEISKNFLFFDIPIWDESFANGNKQLSEFEKGQIAAYNDCELSLCDIAKKLNRYHYSIDVFLKNYKKTGNYPQKERSSGSIWGIIWATQRQCTVTSQKLKVS